MKEQSPFSVVEAQWMLALNGYYSWRNLGADPSLRKPVVENLVNAFRERRAWDRRHGIFSQNVSTDFVSKLNGNNINPRLLGLRSPRLI